MPASDHYRGTNVLLSAGLADPASPRARAWIGATDSDLATSDWALAELASAPGVNVLRTDSQLVQAAGVLARIWPLGSRAGDAMHLAFCFQGGNLALATADRLLERAARARGVDAVRVY